MKKNVLILIIPFILGVFACQNDTNKNPIVEKQSMTKGTTPKEPIVAVSDPPLTQEEQATIIPQSDTLIGWLAKKDFGAIATQVHPQKGLRFSPYSYVEIADDLVFLPAQIAAAASDPKIYTWGYEDGIGDPINMTWDQYYQRYVFNKDYASDTQVAYNAILGKGNTINNRQKAYPKATFVEYHIKGSEKFKGKDWGSLTFAFEKADDNPQKWYLVAIIHGEWTM